MDETRRAPRKEGARGRFRLAAIDIDDTLIGPDGRIGRDNAAAVAALLERGIRVVLASGRSHANMLRFHRELQLGGGPLISAQGAVVREAESGELWFQRAAPAGAVVGVTREGFRRGFSVLHYRHDGIHLQTRSRWTEHDQSRNDEPQVLIPDLLADGGEGVFKVIWLGEPADTARAQSEAARAYAGRLSVTETDPGYLEFSAAGIDKSVALAEVAARLDVAPEQVAAFGDGNNDAAMLAWAGLGIAMSHARPSAQAAADLVAPAGDPESSLSRAVRLLLHRSG